MQYLSCFAREDDPIVNEVGTGMNPLLKRQLLQQIFPVTMVTTLHKLIIVQMYNFRSCNRKFIINIESTEVVYLLHDCCEQLVGRGDGCPSRRPTE
jgi:hypothetical protein